MRTAWARELIEGSVNEKGNEGNDTTSADVNVVKVNKAEINKQPDESLKRIRFVRAVVRNGSRDDSFEVDSCKVYINHNHYYIYYIHSGLLQYVH